MSTQKIVFTGFIISSDSLKKLNILQGFLAVDDGKITKIGTLEEFDHLHKSGFFNDFEVITMKDSQFLMPGFVDCHTHAPQYPNIGLGLDKPLLEWLQKYTFPLEKRYENEEFAAHVYDQVVRRLLINGTTTACYYGSLHLKGTLELVRCVEKYGQRALVGKVSMNVKNDAGYYNETSKEIDDVTKFLECVTNLKNDLIQPVVTPRFAISCDKELMTKLSELAQQYNCMIQSHISENLGEIDYVLELNPHSKHYTDVYCQSNIINNKCIMAHAIYLSEEEMRYFASSGTSIAHCPASNTRLMSGLCPLTTLLAHGIKVGLGTDVSGGDNATILDAMRRAMDVSAHLKLKREAEECISWKEAFYLATLGGAAALNVEHKTGNFQIGKDFDGLLIDVHNVGGPVDRYHYTVAQNEPERAESLAQRFVYLGDDRNITRVFVKGREVKSSVL